MLPILIIKAGTTFPKTKISFGDFDDWTLHYSGLTDKDVSIVEVFDNHHLPRGGSFSGVILTGSHSMVTDQDDWIDKTTEWISYIVEKQIPFLGICFGHQMLAHATGGIAGFHPRGREIGTVEISVHSESKHDHLFRDLPASFLAHTTHLQTVLSLPETAHVLASNDFEPHHAFRIGKCAWGVQFHPEFSSNIMRAYIDEQCEVLVKEGLDIDALNSHVSETVEANSLLKRFVDFVFEKDGG